VYYIGHHMDKLCIKPDTNEVTTAKYGVLRRAFEVASQVRESMLYINYDVTRMNGVVIGVCYIVT